MNAPWISRGRNKKHTPNSWWNIVINISSQNGRSIFPKMLGNDHILQLTVKKKVWFFGGILMFSPLLGEMIQFDEYFSNGLKPRARWQVDHRLKYPSNACWEACVIPDPFGGLWRYQGAWAKRQSGRFWVVVWEKRGIKTQEQHFSCTLLIEMNCCLLTSIYLSLLINNFWKYFTKLGW